MLYKKILFTFFSLFVLVAVGGCWDTMDVNSKTLVVTVIADKQGEDFAFYIETPNLGMGQGSQNGPGETKQGYQTIYAKGYSFADARRQLNAKANNPIFLGTVKALIITDDLAKYGIEEYMLRMQSDVQYRKALHVSITSSDPSEILALTPPNNVAVGESIAETIESLHSQGKIVLYTVSDILDFIYGKSSFVLGNIDIENGFLTYNGYDVIQNSKLIEFIPVDKSRGLVWILGNGIKRIYSPAAVNGCLATIDVDLKSRTITPYYKDGKISFDLRFKMQSLIMYLNKNIRLDKNLQKTIKDELQNQIAADIADAIKHSKQIQCDYMQFKDCFRLKYPNEVKTMDWEKEYLNAEFKISVESTLEYGSMMDFEANGD